jgi:glycosyltransferase involved in cell wall biosynthesis
MQPRVTIGITCFNAQDTIRRAVSSALAQDWPDVEIVAVDDCSKDGSWVILEDIAAREPRLKIVRHAENRGYPSALNTILENASGTFVAIFDDDDDNVPDRLRKQIDRITAYEAASGAEMVFCYANRAIVKAGEAQPDHISKAIGRRAPEPAGSEVADFILRLGATPGKVWGIFGSCTLMARRSTFSRVGPFDPQFRRSAEWDMAIRGAQMGAHFIAVDHPLVTQYKTPTADKSGDIPLRYALKLREKHRAYLDKRHAYLASRLLARSAVHGNKGRRLRKWWFKTLAMATAPHLLASRLTHRPNVRGD